jgi:Sulfotransferase domain
VSPDSGVIERQLQMEKPPNGGGGRGARDALVRRLQRTLPHPAYRALAGGYRGARTLVGRTPGRGRALPDFVIIGAAKAGTTSLYGWLCEHPCVLPAAQKEVHYFDYNHDRGEDWYRSHFPRERALAAGAAADGRRLVTGEASPPYLSHAWAPQRLADLLPQAKLLVTLRDPVDRAYSQFQMSRREGEEPFESFADAVAAEEERLAPEQARCLADPHYNSWPIGCWSYLMRGRYAEQLARWFELFPREQFHVVTLEDIAADPQRVLDGVHDFLGLSAHRYPNLPRLHTAEYSGMTAQERAALADYFRPHNERLYALLGADLGWS